MFRLLGEAPVAPIVPELVYLVIGMSIVLEFVAAYGIKKLYDRTLGALIHALGDLLNFKVWRYRVHLGDEVLKVGNGIEGVLGAWLNAADTHLARWWHGQQKLAEWTYDTLAGFATSTVHAFNTLVHGTIPQAVTTVVSPIRTDLGKLRRALRAEARSLEIQLVHRAHAIEATIERDFGKAWRGIDNVRGVAIPRIWRWAAGAAAAIAALRKYAHGVLGRRLSRLETLVLGAGLSAVILRVLTRHFPYWRCTNVRRFMRGVCRSPFGSLDWLFALSFEAFLVADLCDFIAAVSGAARAVEPELLAFVQLEDVLIGCHGATKPRPLPIPALDAPPVQAGIALGL